jgi:hypothetical protein
MKILMVSLSVLIAASVAEAASDSDALARAGLLGAWAVDCSKPPDQKNPYQLFAPSKSGYPTRTLRMGDPKLDRTSELHNVTVLGDHRVKFRMMGKTGDNRDIVVVVDDNRHRSLEAVDLQGKKYVADGKLTGASSGETPWFQKCGK